MVGPSGRTPQCSKHYQKLGREEEMDALWGLVLEESMEDDAPGAVCAGHAAVHGTPAAAQSPRGTLYSDRLLLSHFLVTLV